MNDPTMGRFGHKWLDLNFILIVKSILSFSVRACEGIVNIKANIHLKLPVIESHYGPRILNVT